MSAVVDVAEVVEGVVVAVAARATDRATDVEAEVVTGAFTSLAVVVADLFSMPGAVESPGGVLPDWPAPLSTISAIFAVVLGPTIPTDSMPCCSWNRLIAISVEGPK